MATIPGPNAIDSGSSERDAADFDSSASSVFVHDSALGVSAG